MTLFSTEHPFTTGIDISSSAFWAQPFDERDKSFARLRAGAPISWHRPTDWHEPHAQQGFWAVTRASDIRAVSLDSARFCSSNGTTLDPLDPALSTAASFFLTMDAPAHPRYRSLVSAAFTPKAIGRLGQQIEANAERIVDDLVGAGDVDFVEACSARLPMETVSDLVGVPEADRARLALAAERLVGGADVVTDPPRPMAEIYDLLANEMFFILGVGQELAAHRRAHPADDLLTNLVQAEIDGVGLTDDDIGAFLVLISVAGNDTTKQTTSLGMLALQEHPEQRDRLTSAMSDEHSDGRIGLATEELVRWASPVMQFARTATEDTRLGDAEIAAGDKVVLFYCSGNRDESVLAVPHSLDLERAPNPHVGFGGGGAHYCLGNGVAKIQLRALFRQLLTRVPKIEFGEPVQLQSNFINGVSQLPAHVG